MGQKIDVGNLSDDQALNLFVELAEHLQEHQVLEAMRVWLKEHGLEGELDAD